MSGTTKRIQCLGAFPKTDTDGNAVFNKKVTAGADPTEDMDLVTLKYLNTVVGDIETALDAIIATQEALIGDIETALDAIIATQEALIGGESA